MTALARGKRLDNNSVKNSSNLNVVTEDEIRGAHAASAFDLDLLDEKAAFARRDDDAVFVEAYDGGRLVRFVRDDVRDPDFHQLAAARSLQITEGSRPWIEGPHAVP